MIYGLDSMRVGLIEQVSLSPLHTLVIHSCRSIRPRVWPPSDDHVCMPQQHVVANWYVTTLLRSQTTHTVIVLVSVSAPNNNAGGTFDVLVDRFCRIHSRKSMRMLPQRLVLSPQLPAPCSSCRLKAMFRKAVSTIEGYVCILLRSLVTHTMRS